MHENEIRSLESACDVAICTLFDGDFHFGLAALLNSLVRSGYKGTVWAGYRGSLPPWLHQLRRLNANEHEYLVGDQVRLVLLLVEANIHLALYKPQFMINLLENQARDCKYIWFFDADIFVRCSWFFFEDWQRCGIALCQDILHRILPENDPLRHKWMEIGTALGLGSPRPLIQYFNSGLVSVSAENISFLHLWQRLIQYAGQLGVNLNRIASGTRDMPFHIPDQDALNIAAMYTEHPLSPTGPEVMGFLPGRSNLYHSVGPKPWRGSPFLRALAGMQPSGAAKFFFTQVSSPIHPYSALHLQAKKLECATASFIGRFYAKK
jgi:hypothetical protein